MSEPPDPRTDGESLADEGDTSLLALVDRLAVMLERSDLTELEVEAGGTGLVLRKRGRRHGPAARRASRPPRHRAIPRLAGEPSTAGREPPARPSVKAPLTGIWYGSPAPGLGALRPGRGRGRRRPGHRSHRGDEAVQRDQVGPRRSRRPGRRRERPARQGQAAAHRGGAPVNEPAGRRSAERTSPAGGATRRRRSSPTPISSGWSTRRTSGS